MGLTERDVACCPPPLFHCFGLTLGLLGCITHGSSFVIPDEVFNPRAVIQAITQEKCTVLHGVPTMFAAALAEKRPAGFDCSRLRTGIAGGAPMPPKLMEDLRRDLNLVDLTGAYGG